MKNKILLLLLIPILLSSCKKKLGNEYAFLVGKYKLATPLVAKIDDSFDDNWAAGK